jgi:hypothetical protein
MVTGSITGIWWNIISISLRQRIVLDEMLGRVMRRMRCGSPTAARIGCRPAVP